MFARFLPREEKFFDLFSEMAGLLVDGAKQTRWLIEHPADRESLALKMKDLESVGDKVTHRTIALLRKTFITPLDRDDMHHLISKMDNVLDALEAAAQRVFIYDIEFLPSTAHALAEVCEKTTTHVQAAISGLGDIKAMQSILLNCVEVNRLENEADNLLRDGLARLFREEPDTRHLIKLKEIYELLETASDRCEDVADIIDRIVLERG